MIKVYEIERETRFYESMMNLLATSGASPEVIKQFVQDYAAVLYPDQDMKGDAFKDKAEEVVKKYFKKPFVVSTVGRDSVVLHPTEEQLKQAEAKELDS